jgi:hypothetical protein
MRLNFNNIGRGLEAIAGAKQAQDLARTSAKYDVTEGAYGEGLGENLQQVIGARDQALQGLGEQATPEQRQQVLDQYTPAMSELSRRVGLQGPDYSIASGGQNFDTRQDARMAAAPLRSEALAGVYRQYGDVERADALEARAQELQRGLTADRIAKAAEDRAAGLYSTNMTKLGLDINAATRADAAAQAEDTRQKENAAWWVQQTTDPETGKRRAPRPEDWLAASQRDAVSYLEKGDYTKGGQAFDAFMNRAESLILKDEKERTRDAQKAFDAFNTSRSDESIKLGLELYNKYLPNGSKATSAKLDSKGMIVMSHTDLSGNKLPDTKVTPEQYMQGLASFGDSKAALKFVRESFQDNLAIKESNQRNRGLDLQERNVVVNEDTAQSNKISNMKRDIREDNKANQPTPQTVKQFKDAKTGESVLVDVSRLEVGKDGVLKTPKGLIAVNAKTEPSDAAVVRQATEIMADRRNYKMVGGKLVPPTMAEATAMAKANLRKQSATDGADDDTDRIIRLMEAARAGNNVDSGSD